MGIPPIMSLRTPQRARRSFSERVGTNNSSRTPATADGATLPSAAAEGMLRDVRLPRDPRFDDERERFALRHCCEDCSYFDPDTGACRHFWPNREHRGSHYVTPGTEVVFCKEFELL
jgi:hypothetical protein